MFSQQTMSGLALAMLAMAPSVRGHMIMASPKPFGSPNNSPLDPSGSDYPCKMTSATAGEGPMNDFKVGSTQQLSFSGSAVHGGGSCQLAVTTDKNPTKNSNFKVIHSIEGGCPGVGGPANFEFTVPDALPNGEAVFAWTWFNHIGNREMYMNCAHITVSGGSDDTSKFEALPDMALANINVGSGASCKTQESNDYTFEGVGKNGDTVDRVGSGPFAALCGGAASSPPAGGNGGGSADTGSGSGSGSGSGAGAGSGSGGQANNGQYTPDAGQGGTAQQTPAGAPAAPAPAVSSPPAQAPAAEQPAVAITSTLKTMVTVTATPSAPAVKPTPPPAAGSPPSNGSAPAAPAPPAAGAPATGGEGQSCPTDGAVVCNGESQFGLCNHGKVVFMAVSAGTKCQGGKVLRKRHFVHRAHRASF